MSLVLSTLVSGGIVAFVMYVTSVISIAYPIHLDRLSGPEMIWAIFRLLGLPLFVLLAAIAVLAFPAFRAADKTSEAATADRDAYRPETPKTIS